MRNAESFLPLLSISGEACPLYDESPRVSRDRKAVF